MSDLTSYRDMLDIIFSTRNRAYGAYLLRREYPKYLFRALILGLILLTFLFGLPLILAKVSSLIPKKMENVEIELGPPPDIAKTPPPPPPPKLETPPPPTRSTVKFVPPVVKKDEEVVEEKPPVVEELLEKKEDIGGETKKGNDEAPPTVEENPSDLKVVEEAPKPVVDEAIHDYVEKPPSFPGGEAELLKYLSANIKYPALARESSIQGRAIVSFVVNKRGEIDDVKLVRDIGGGCGKEAVRVVSSMPKWIPGEQNGHAVKVRYTLPVMFKLE